MFVEKSCRLFFVVSLFFVLSYIFCLFLWESSDQEFRTPLPIKQPAPLTILNNNGGLGNQTFTYATLFGLSSLNKRKMEISENISRILSKYFNIKTPVVNVETFVETNPWPIGNWLTERDHHIPELTNILTGNVYPTSYTFFHHIRREVQDVFRFKPFYKKHAQDVLWRIKRQRPLSRVFIGVHVRRGDYLRNSKNRGWLSSYDGREVDNSFFEKATKYFISKYKNIIFLAISDDRQWCRNNLINLGILTTPDSPSEGHDIALLVECNHTIMTYGTYGFLGGYLSGGVVVYFTDFLKPNTTFLKEYFVYEKMYPPDWIGISTTEPEFWESFTNPDWTNNLTLTYDSSNI